MMKKSLAIFAVLVLCVSILAGCERSTPPLSETSGGAAIILSGKYVATNLDDAGAMFFLEAIDFNLEDVYIEFAEDGTLTLYILGEGVAGTYSGTGNTATVTMREEDEPAILTVDGNKVILSGEHGGTITFEKEQ